VKPHYQVLAAELIAQIERAREATYAQLSAVEASARTLLASISMPDAPILDRLRFDSPVGTEAERAAGPVWPGDWFDATGYAYQYPSTMNRSDYHTGVDLNRPNYKDAGAPVHACADGVVVVSARFPVWLDLVVVKHSLENGEARWSRYAHLKNRTVARGQRVRRGDLLAYIGDYGSAGPAGDHLHFDLAVADIGAHPTDWPGADLARLKRDYVDPLLFIRERHSGAP